jgi:hypothetical protein
MGTGKLLPTGPMSAHCVVILEASGDYSPWQSASTTPILGRTQSAKFKE